MPVYSTDKGRHPKKKAEPAPPPAGDGIIRLQRQVKGRNGKPVIIVTGLPLTGPDLKALAKKLKTKCGVGGAIDGHDIVIQGDKRDVIQTELEQLGYKVKRSGG